MKIVVTGGAGFIGSHFVDHLADLGLEVIVIDNLVSGNKKNLESSLPSRKITLFQEDIVNFEKIKSFFSGVDAIVHFAAATGIIESLEKPRYFTEVNVIGTLNLLEICREYKIPKFVFASTAAVYGEQDPPFLENMYPKPISPYAASKVAAENYCLTYNKTFGISCSILRFSNVFGPRKSFGPYANVIPKFVRAVLRNEPITIYGDGFQERDFVFVKDVARACFLSLPKKINGTFNIATGINTNINELVKILENILGNEISKNYTDPRKGEAKYAFSSIERAKKELTFEPKFSLKDGLMEYINYEKGQLGVNHKN